MMSRALLMMASTRTRWMGLTVLCRCLPSLLLCKECWRAESAVHGTQHSACLLCLDVCFCLIPHIPSHRYSISTLLVRPA
jgi:hypothetical protein